MNEYLRATEFLDWRDPVVAEFAAANTMGKASDIDKAVALYFAVRDGFQYDPYLLDLRPQGLRASDLVRRKRGYCVEKAVLLAASCRAVGVPSRLSFYIVRNHIATGRLERLLKTDYLVFHGATEIMLEGDWRKATPAFNRNLCVLLGVEPLDFDGKSDSIFQEFSSGGSRFMEYIHEYGSFSDLPYEMYLEELNKHYSHVFEGEKYSKGDLVFDFRQDEKHI